MKTSKDYNYSELADSTYENCKTFRKLERKYLNGIEYEYSIPQDVQDALEEADPTGKQLEKFCTNLKEIEEFDSKTEQERDNHMANCDICAPYWEALQVSRSELN